MSVTILAPGDLVFTRSPTPLGWAIRLFQTSPGEAPSVVNHCEIVTKGGLLSEAEVIGALHHVRRARLIAAYGPPRKTPIAIYRARGLTNTERIAIARKAESYEGRRYGYLKIGAHLGDWTLTRLTGREIYAFRRLARMDRYPMCSWLADHAYREVGISFGPAPAPDDLWDEVTANLLGWTCVRPLRPLSPVTLELT